MRRLMLLVGAMLFLSVAAAAQENDAALAFPASAAAPAPPQGGGPGFTSWQLTIGYQFNHLIPLGESVNSSGVNLSLVRYFTGRFGLEANVGAGFGHNGATIGGCPVTCVNTVFVGGGAHYSLVRDRRLEPWVHGLIGLEHFRFSQNDTFNSMNAFGYIVGGGLDWNFNPRTALRGQVDYLGTHVSGANQSNLQAIAGLVINF